MAFSAQARSFRQQGAKAMILRDGGDGDGGSVVVHGGSWLMNVEDAKLMVKWSLMMVSDPWW